ncbi:hypothetical protein BV22DRAFT_483891 [Leucogyrophana mollusca]|uniref:Uncharacterized protein n=1 Tax=Leucogyrophana mollusca TaxID=85980 RepID=A0ACB8BHU0_9AGAM|nr:hypothetical protein BV22DRAFT_483891 [Leucogyrophana mollusca]
MARLRSFAPSIARDAGWMMVRVGCAFQATSPLSAICFTRLTVGDSLLADSSTRPAALTKPGPVYFHSHSRPK